MVQLLACEERWESKVWQNPWFATQPEQRLSLWWCGSARPCQH